MRVPLDLTPAAEGTRIELSGVSASPSIGSVQVGVLVIALSCAACGGGGRAITLALSALDERERACRAWCEGCSALVGASLRPALVAPAADPAGSGAVIAHVDTEACVLLDVLPASELFGTCLACGTETKLAPLQRGRRTEADCRGCFAKLALCAREIRIERLADGASARALLGGSGGGRRPRGAGGGGDGGKSFDAELRAFRAAAHAGGVPSFRAGEALPLSGACDHFKKSRRWLRFGCCGRALPCPICHERSGCPAAELGVRANAMICGLCSREQPFSDGRCACGADFAAHRSAHWNGGTGCRDATRLSRKDARKHAGAQKTASKKASRVGARGAEARGARVGAEAR